MTVCNTHEVKNKPHQAQHACPAGSVHTVRQLHMSGLITEEFELQICQWHTANTVRIYIQSLYVR